MRIRRLLAAVILPVALLPLSMPLAAQPIRLVTRTEIMEAMRRQRALGYDVLATANGARFSAGVLLDLAKRARTQAPLLVNHHDYFEAFLQVNSLTRDKAPIFARVADEYGEDQFIDPRPEKVIRKIAEGQPPQLAVNIVSGWHSGAKSEYEYDDLSSTPHLRVIHKRISSYRLLDFGDALLFDEVSGVLGRATDGLLGAMFRIIGNGTAARSFTAFAMDGVQVTRTTAKKGPITITETATVTLDGRGQKGLLPNRPDLAQLEERLKKPFSAQYVPLADDPDQWPRP